MINEFLLKNESSLSSCASFTWIYPKYPEPKETNLDAFTVLLFPIPELLKLLSNSPHF